MSSPTLLPNLIAGNKGATDLSIGNMGIKPIGNGAGSNLPGPSGLGMGGKVGGATPIPLGVSLNPATQEPPVSPILTGSPTAVPVNTGATGSDIVNPNDPNNLSTNVRMAGELNNIFGSGVGGLINSVAGDIGSTDSSYMQKYKDAMAGSNAEKLATLETTLGNEGVSADSSTAAIAQADFESGVVADEGLQEQQLQMNDLAQLLGLTESLEAPAQAAQADSGWNLFGKVVGDVGGAVAGAVAKKYI